MTFSIGGNDADFGDVVAECALGVELLPFNTCFSEDKVTEPVAEAFARLDNLSASPAETTPYDTLYKDVRRRAPYATYVAMGYPPFFTPEGSDRTFLPGGRCELIKKADQKWMVSKIAEFNALIKRNAERNGFRFADPDVAVPRPRAVRRRTASGSTARSTPASLHPTAAGQQAMSAAVLEKLLNDDRPRFEVHPGQTAEYQFVIDKLLDWLSTIINWPGSDVELTLVSPSGQDLLARRRRAPASSTKTGRPGSSSRSRTPSRARGR